MLAAATHPISRPSPTALSSLSLDSERDSNGGCDGTAVGAAKGATEGDEDGAADGNEDGAAEGDEDGDAVGDTVGDLVGIFAPSQTCSVSMASKFELKSETLNRYSFVPTQKEMHDLSSEQLAIQLGVCSAGSTCVVRRKTRISPAGPTVDIPSYLNRC
jgi:hypothetical protein